MNVLLYTHYHTLGVKHNATLSEIKEAFRILAKVFHPDKTNGDKFLESKFLEIKSAYSILSDVKEREKYDDFLSKITITYNGKNENIERFINPNPIKLMRLKPLEEIYFTLKDIWKSLIFRFVLIGFIAILIYQNISLLTQKDSPLYIDEPPRSLHKWLSDEDFIDNEPSVGVQKSLSLITPEIQANEDNRCELKGFFKDENDLKTMFSRLNNMKTYLSSFEIQKDKIHIVLQQAKIENIKEDDWQNHEITVKINPNK